MKKPKCPSCGESIVKFPLRDVTGKFLWKNLFKTDLISILFILSIIFMLLGYKADIAQCEDAINEPCKFCNSTGCCSYQTCEYNEEPTIDFKRVMNNGESIQPISQD